MVLASPLQRYDQKHSQFLNTVLTLETLTSLDLLLTVLKVLSQSSAFRGLALFTNNGLELYNGTP